MKIKTWIKYTEGFLPAPKSRKMKYKECESYIDIELREVALNDVKKSYSVDDNIYYLYEGELYIKTDSKDISCFKIENPIENLKYCNEHCSSNFGFGENDTKKKMINKATESINRYLLIDGTLYEVTGRPFYRIYTFGLGKNHAGIGTSLSICNRDCEYYAEEDICFNANDRERAINDALTCAINRGDTKSIEHIKSTPIIIEY